MEHYTGLIAGYAAAMGLFWSIWAALGDRRATLQAVAYRLSRPGLELVLAFAAAAGVILIGQLYVAGRLLPDEGELLQSANQALIFAPMLALALWRGQPLSSTFLPLRGAAPGLALGAVAAAAALFVYMTARGLWSEPGAVAATLLDPANTSYAVQIFLQDLSIAVILSRLLALAGWKVTLILIALLFQLAHIPPFLAGGAGMADLATLLIDTGIGLAVFGAVIASRSIWWFWPLHTVMDLMQFHG